MTIAPASIDVSGSAQTVAFAMHITDDLSGTSSVRVFVVGPSGQNLNAFANRSAGTSLDGTYTATMSFPQFAAAGTWTVSFVQVQDVAGNFSNISTEVLTSRGFPTQITVTSTPDVEAPNLVGVSITPWTMDVSAADQLLTVDVHLTDDISGVALNPCPNQNANFTVILRSPSGAQNRFAWGPNFQLVSGTRLDGVWRSTVNMPRFSEAGTWQIQNVAVQDCAGNVRFYTSTSLSTAGLQLALAVSANPTDVQRPTLTSLSFVPITINTSTGNQNVTVQLGIHDDLAGAEFSPTLPQVSFLDHGIQFRSPSGAQTRTNGTFTPWTLVSGTPQDGVWQSTIGFPQFSEEGTWKIDFGEIKDRTRNLFAFNATTLQSLGFPTNLEVIKPSLISDGTITSAGGQISDQTFGDRASIIFPPGAVSTSTSVAIDVLSKPLDIPNPTGFSGPGTLYVNIQLTPEPTFPLPSPGLTIILPLQNPMPSGTQLKLYKVDPATGQLVPELDVFGNPATGFVDADGLSATFIGVAGLSTVVGLLPQAINVAVDIKPGATPNTINLKSKGVLPVAILSTETFDATSIDAETLLLSGANVKIKNNGQPIASFEDVNGDGRLDLVVQFDVQTLELTSNDTQADLTGRTKNGIRIVGHDQITIVPQ